MTPEELNRLKPGDDIFIRAKYNEILEDGDVLFSHTFTNTFGEVIKTSGYTHMENVILPPPAPKYDPCRLFKKGDKVKRRTVDGRTDQEISEGIELTVIYGEDKYGNVRVQNPNGICIVTKSVFLELVSPVEERSPYYVKETASVYEVLNRNENNSSVAIFFKIQYSIEKAKERAEAECARLNAEHRKEQNND